LSAVTVIETQRNRKGTVKVFLDGGAVFNLSLPIVVEAGINEGQVIALSEIERLKSDDIIYRSMNSILKYMSLRPRSEAEIRLKLRRRGFAEDTIERVLTKLSKQGLVDDVTFAKFWRENRENYRPISRRLMALELRQKEVARETIDDVIAGLEDESNAYRAAQKKAHLLEGLDYASFRRRLGAFLKRRGFDYELVNHTVDRVWQELDNGQTN